MKQTLNLYNQCGYSFLNSRPHSSLVVVTDPPKEVDLSPIVRASRFYIIYGGNELLVSQRRPGEERIGGEKIIRPYLQLLELLEPTTIVDPFMGTGTIGEAALRTGHSFIGIEAIKTRYALCVERLTPLVNK